MFFTAIHQMMTEGVDLTLVIRKANGQLTVSLLPKSNGLKDEAQNHQSEGNERGKGEAGEVRETFQESGGTDRRQEPQGGGYRARAGTSLRLTTRPEENRRDGGGTDKGDEQGQPV